MSNFLNTFLKSPSEVNSNKIDFFSNFDLESSIKKDFHFTNISEFDLNLDCRFESKKISEFELKKQKLKIDVFLDYSPITKNDEFDNRKISRKKKKDKIKKFTKNNKLARKESDCKKEILKKKKIKKRKKKQNLYQIRKNNFTDSSEEEFVYEKNDEKFQCKFNFINPKNFEILKKICQKKFLKEKKIDLNFIIFERELESIKNGYYDCDNCNNVFGSNQALAGHIFKHHS